MNKVMLRKILVITFLAIVAGNVLVILAKERYCSETDLPRDGVAYSEPSANWTVTLGTRFDVPNTCGVPTFDITPDGRFSMLPDVDGGWIMFWPEYETYRTRGQCALPEFQARLSPASPVMGGFREEDAFDNSGAWLMSVARINGTSLIGFVHCEYKWFPRVAGIIGWKSIGVAYSSDNGASWSAIQQIITSAVPVPASPANGGLGDMCVVWDGARGRWTCIYQEHFLHVAVSYDPLGAPGTWYKWNGTDFSSPGLGGAAEPIGSLAGTPGANPSIHWNTHLARWVMVYGGWDNCTHITASTDLLAWDAPRLLVRSRQDGRAWYPTIASGHGDLLAGQEAHLYYADIEPSFKWRDFTGIKITFGRVA